MATPSVHRRDSRVILRYSLFDANLRICAAFQNRNRAMRFWTGSLLRHV